jgi:Flp pilus assembly protein TadG
MRQVFRFGTKTACLLREIRNYFARYVVLNKKFFSRFMADCSGSFAAVFAITVTLLVLGVGVAIDTNAMHKSKAQMQDMADAAVLAASKSGETELTTLQGIASDYVAANNLSSQPITTHLNVTSNGRINVSINGQYDTQFMAMFGKSNVTINAVAQAPLSANEPVNIALVLDNTGSMGGAKLAALKVAATRLIDTLDVFEPGMVEISVVPFDRYVNVGTASRGEVWLDVLDDGYGNGTWRGCVGSRPTPWNVRDQYASRKIKGLMNVNCGQNILPLTSNFDAARSAINSMTAQGWTYIPSGLAWGWRALTNRQPLIQAPGAGANEKNIIILMTDGANTRSKTSIRHNGWSTYNANLTTSNMCTNVKSSQIEIYTIAFEIADITAKNLMKNCASQLDMYFDAANAAQLDAAFDEIAENLVNLRLTH